MDFLKEKCKFMKYIISAFLLICVYACDQEKTNAKTEIKDAANSKDSVKNISSTISDEYLITDTSFGKINKTTTFKDLEKIFGKINIQDTIGYGAEGIDSFIITRIYSNTPKEIIINWQQNKLHKAISRIDIYQDNAPYYYTPDSLKIGSTLEKLLQVNGKKIIFTGTSWDYGGMISSYNGGRLNNSKLFFRLASSPSASEQIMGDHELNTDMSLVKANLKKLYISNISLTLDNSR